MVVSYKDKKVDRSIMDDICNALETINVLPDFILNDLEYIAQCYIQGTTEIDFSQVADNTYSQEQPIELNEYTYNQMFVVLRKKLENIGQHIDKVLIYSYLDYYVESFLEPFVHCSR